MIRRSTPTLELRRELVRRIAESDSFRRSQRLREMLLYISECTLAGHPEEFSESRIAEHVFGRDRYEPTVDSLVRVAARQLRGKIHEYFAAEGRAEERTLEIPKGGYAVVFKRPPSPSFENHRSVVEPGPSRRSAKQAWMARRGIASYRTGLPLVGHHAEYFQLRKQRARSQ